MSPQDLAIYSLLTGAGGYGATRLLHNAMSNVEEAVTPSSLNPNANLNQITLRLPKKPTPADPNAVMAPKVADVPAPTAPGGLEPWQYVPLAIGGAGLGYYGAGKIHDFIQRRMAENQLKDTQKRFQDTIQQYQQAKMASDTPLVDAYCEVMSAATAELEKAANWMSDAASGLGHIVGINGTNISDAGHSIASATHHINSFFDGAAKDATGQPYYATGPTVPGSDWAMKDVLKPAAAGLGTLGVIKFLADKTQRMEQDDERNKAKLPQAINVVQE